MPKNYPAYNIYVIHQDGCIAQSGFEGYARKFSGTVECTARNIRALETLRMMSPSTIVISGAKRDNPEELARISDNLVAQLRDAGHTAIWLADFNRPGVSLVDCVAAPAVLISDQFIEDRCRGNAHATASDIEYNRRSEAASVDMVRINDIQCPREICAFFDRGRLLYRDDHHLNVDGSVHFIGLLSDRMAF